MAEQSRLDKVIALARHRGFVFQAGEIYGGSRSAWDYGPLGTELKENIRRQWWQTFVRGRGDMVGLDSSIILPKRVWEASGHVATFTDPLVECLQLPQALPRRQPHRGLRGAQGPHGRERPRRRAVPELRHEGPVHRAEGLLGSREDLPRRRRRRVGPALPAPRDRAGHLRELRERAHGLPQEAAVRHRPGRQGVPQRDHARQLHLPHARVRADGDRVLHAAGRGAASGSSTGSRPAGTGSSTSASTPPTCAGTTCPKRTAPTTRPARSTSSTSSASPARSGASSWASPTAPTTTSSSHTEASGQSLSYFDQASGREVHPVRHRAVVRPDARDDGVPRRRVPRGGGAEREGRHRHPHGAQARPASRAREGRGAAAVAQRAALADRPRGGRRRCAASGTSTSTTPAPSAAATAARTRSARRSASRSTSTRSTTARSPCATATRWARSACRSRACTPTSRSASRGA